MQRNGLSDIDVASPPIKKSGHRVCFVFCVCVGVLGTPVIQMAARRFLFKTLNNNNIQTIKLGGAEKGGE
jgi:hypothetical protein